MIAPRMPRNQIKAVSDTMHTFIMSQLEQICEDDEEAPLAENCFSRVMEVLYERGIEMKHLQYYEHLYELAQHEQEQRRKTQKDYRVVGEL